MASDIGPEDQKLITLARGARGRVSAVEGAALRDETGRSYSGATVSLSHLSLSALQLAVAQAVASGARGVEAAVLVSREGLEMDDLIAVRDLGGSGVPILVVTPSGEVTEQVTT